MKNKYLIISEIACSHNGNYNNLKQLVKNSYLAGANAVQFQIWKASNMRSKYDKSFKILNKLEIPFSGWKKIIKYTKKKFPNLKIYCCIYDIETFNFIKKFNIDGIKINAADTSSLELLHELRKFKKKINICTGGVYDNEIKRAIKIIGKRKRITLMHGIQLFPTDSKIINLNRLRDLKKKFKLTTGYQDHSDPNNIDAYIFPILSIFYGAEVIEKHITLSRSLKGADYQSSFEFLEFKKLVNFVKKTQFDKFDKKKYKASFQKYRNYNNKIFFFSKDVKKGEIVDSESIKLKTNSEIKNGIRGDMINKILNKILTNNKKKDTPVLVKNVL